MKFIETPLAKAFVVELEPFRDERGIFARTFCKKEFEQIGFDRQIVQINYSLTRQKGAIRGMHYQCPPASEIKTSGVFRRVFDVMVDIRKDSPNFAGYGMELSNDNSACFTFWKGFAHGF